MHESNTHPLAAEPSSLIISGLDEPTKATPARILIPEDIKHLNPEDFPESQTILVIDGHGQDEVLLRELLEGIARDEFDGAIVPQVEDDAGRTLSKTDLKRIADAALFHQRRIRLTVSNWEANIRKALMGPKEDGANAIARDGDVIICPSEDAETWGRAYAANKCPGKFIEWRVSYPSKKELESEMFEIISLKVDDDGRSFRDLFPRNKRRTMAKEIVKGLMAAVKKERREQREGREEFERLAAVLQGTPTTEAPAVNV